MKLVKATFSVLFQLALSKASTFVLSCIVQGLKIHPITQSAQVKEQQMTGERIPGVCLMWKAGNPYIQEHILRATARSLGYR